MADHRIAEKSSFRRFQSDFILPLARSIYVIAAFICFIGVGVALATALYFQIQSKQVAPEALVPASYVAPAGAMINFDSISARLSPPRNIRFVAIPSVIDHVVNNQEVLGYLDADTPNGLAKYPNDFDILGGKDAGLFNRVSFQNRQTVTGLSVTPALAQEINKIISTLSTQQSHSYEIKVIARDSNGNRSEPTDIIIKLVYGPLNLSVGPIKPLISLPPPNQMTELQRLARDIALLIDPGKTTLYFDTYTRALQVPQNCGATDADTNFITNYRQSFEKMRNLLTPQLVEIFYGALCDGWHQLRIDQSRAQAEAEKVRLEVIAENQAARVQAEGKKLFAIASEGIAIRVAGAAVGMFLTISLLLAFLAIENHSKAMREAIEILAERQEYRNIVS